MSPMIGITSYLARPATSNLARAFAESIPDGRASTILIHGTLNLVSSRREAPQEIGGKSGLFNGSHGEVEECYSERIDSWQEQLPRVCYK